MRYLKSWAIKKQLVIRNLLTSLIKHGQLVTTTKKAKVLKSFADKFFNSAKNIFLKYNNEQVIKNELIRLANIYLTNDGWPYRFGWKRKESKQLNVKEKFVDLIAPKLREVEFNTWYVQDYKLGLRKWDSGEQVLIKLRPELLSNVEAEVK